MKHFDRTKILSSRRDPVREKSSWGCFGVGLPPKAHLDNVASKRGEDWRLENYI
jgi:hypothetical protein